MKQFIYLALTLLALASTACRGERSADAESQAAEEPQHTILYGIIADNYRTESGTIAQGETLGKLLGRYGVTAATVDRLDKAAKEIFPLLLPTR